MWSEVEDFSIQGTNGIEFCDKCSDFRLEPDPDPYDWFRDSDMKAVCCATGRVIEDSLEKPSEWTNIPRPRFCPKLGREVI